VRVPRLRPPGDARPATPAIPRDDLVLCYEHRAMLFYNVDEFLRLWEEKDPIEGAQRAD
jgi:hypothetical protein